ncbi:CHAT domain-containing protein [Okeania sp.]|uniref:CHAT domain-containing protein n=1 Tax=Okeania sp. TaxID=3100323 RepID=UPI002B4B6054|nr:CHAT domain-containing protein [Okeania sp.]MEB3343465.1 CHAT domain-containing protein [Okeania sp.]
MFHQKWKKRIIFAWLFTLIFISTITLNIILSQPSAIAVKEEDWDRFLQQKNFVEAVNQVEQHWERDYENYFDENLADFSLTAEDIAKTLTNLSQQSGTKPAVIWIWQREKQMQLILITPGKKPEIYSVLDVERQKLINTLRKFNVEITNPIKRKTTSYLEPGQKLYEWMVKPLESRLKAEKIDTIMFCLGANLRTIPLAALHDGENFIIEKYAITQIPAFNLIDTNYNQIKNAQILAMGASEFKELPSLPAVPVEIDKITKFLGKGKALMNQEFTVKNLQQQRQKQPYEIVHLATHAEFKPGKPDKSYIQFWDDEKIGLDEIEKLKLNQPPVELLVLSACRTALGDKEAELGFAGLTVKSGVRSALASLWYVSDIGTLGLMTEFYEHLQKTPLKAEALRQAQVAMLKGKVGVNKGKLNGTRGELKLPPEFAEFGDESFSHPYYWSGFTLIGNPW